jgi:5-methylcytosine-specific restriction endonuclease McrA
VSIARYYNPRLRARIAAGDSPGWLQRHPRRAYIVAAILSAPPWVDRAAVNVIRDEARRLTAETGVPHVLDHVVPLSHPMVCGLTVPWNLRVITYAQNAAKSNRWHPDQLELFA